MRVYLCALRVFCVKCACAFVCILCVCLCCTYAVIVSVNIYINISCVRTHRARALVCVCVCVCVRVRLALVIISNRIRTACVRAQAQRTVEPHTQAPRKRARSKCIGKAANAVSLCTTHGWPWKTAAAAAAALPATLD